MLRVKKRVLLHKSFDPDLRDNFSFKRAEKHLANALCNYLELESHQDFLSKLLINLLYAHRTKSSNVFLNKS